MAWSSDVAPGSAPTATLRALRPGQAATVRFIVLANEHAGESGYSSSAGVGACRKFQNRIWVADETASITLVLKGNAAPLASLLQPGEIFWLSDGEATINDSEGLILHMGRNGRLQRDGFLTLLFEEEPNLSTGPWRPLETEHASDSAPVQQQKSKKREQSRQRNQQQTRQPEKDQQQQQHQQQNATPQVAPTSVGPQQNSGSATCFLCGDSGHVVFECHNRDNGVTVRCPALDSGPPARRDHALHEALRASGLPQAERVNWYKKGATEGTMYVLFKSRSDAQQVLEARDFSIGKLLAKTYAVTAPRSQSERRPKRKPGLLHDAESGTAAVGEISEHATGKHLANKPSEEQQALSPAVLASSPSARSSRSRSRPRPPHAPEAEEQVEADAGNSCLLCQAQGHNAKQCSESASAAIILGVQAFQTQAVRLALARCGIRATGMWPQQNSMCLVRVGDPSQARQLCGLAQRGQVELHGRQLRVFLLNQKMPDGAPLPNTSPEEASKGSRKGDGRKAGKQRKGTRGGDLSLPTDPSPDDTQNQHKFKAGGREASHGCRKQCFLCGEPGHEIPTCPKQSECVLVCREWGAAQASESAAQKTGRLRILEAALVEILKSEGFELQRSYWHKGVCYVHLADAASATRLLARCGQQGLEAAGEVLRVRRARTTRLQAPNGDISGVADVESDGGADGNTAEASISTCPLCGSSDHSLADCPNRARGVVVRCDAFRAGRDRGEAEVRRLLSDMGHETVDQLRWHGKSLYLTLPDEAKAAMVVEVAAGEGSEIDGELASIERVTRTATASHWQGPVLSHMAGLRPKQGRGR